MVERENRENLFAQNYLLKYTVSSTLNRNHKEFGKKHLLDGRADTCWNSDMGLPQQVSVVFREPHRLSSVSILAQ